jgi:hypothetical protein
VVCHIRVPNTADLPPHAQPSAEPGYRLGAGGVITRKPTSTVTNMRVRNQGGRAGSVDRPRPSRIVPGEGWAQRTGRGRRPRGRRGRSRPGDRVDRGLAAGRLHLGAGATSSVVRTARALVRGPLAGTAQAVWPGSFPAHTQVLAQATYHLPAHLAARGRTGAGGHRPPPGPTRLRRAAAPSASSPTRTGPRNSGSADACVSWPAATSKPARCPRPVGCGPSWRWWWTWTAAATLRMGWVGRWGGRDPWTRRPAAGWPVTGPAPGS